MVFSGPATARCLVVLQSTKALCIDYRHRIWTHDNVDVLWHGPLSQTGDQGTRSLAYRSMRLSAEWRIHHVVRRLGHGRTPGFSCWENERGQNRSSPSSSGLYLVWAERSLTQDRRHIPLSLHGDTVLEICLLQCQEAKDSVLFSKRC